MTCCGNYRYIRNSITIGTMSWHWACCCTGCRSVYCVISRIVMSRCGKFCISCVVAVCTCLICVPTCFCTCRSLSCMVYVCMIKFSNIFSSCKFRTTAETISISCISYSCTGCCYCIADFCAAFMVVWINITYAGVNCSARTGTLIYSGWCTGCGNIYYPLPICMRKFVNSFTGCNYRIAAKTIGISCISFGCTGCCYCIADFCAAVMVGWINITYAGVYCSARTDTLIYSGWCTGCGNIYYPLTICVRKFVNSFTGCNYRITAKTIGISCISFGCTGCCYCIADFCAACMVVWISCS
jgi:hypothetical protein